MMGRQRGGQASLFNQLRLDDRVPKDHLLQSADRLARCFQGVHWYLGPFISVSFLRSDGGISPRIPSSSNKGPPRTFQRKLSCPQKARPPSNVAQVKDARCVEDLTFT